MELNDYQRKVMKNLSDYMEQLNTTNNVYTAWSAYWNAQDVAVGIGGIPAYNNTINGVPHVCMKVPTGGGKTFMACAALKRLFDAMPIDKPRVVIWLVPSDSILLQTIKTLSSVEHSYRQKLDKDFQGKVGIYTKDMLLNGQNFSPDTVREMLTVCILSYGSLRINSNKKDIRKVYQENGNLIRFAKYFNDKELLLADTPDTALIQVLRQLSPVTVVDESHNAGSVLSVEMINNLNPSFILDLTATPRTNSNVISYVDARELKSESMVKLPVIVYNRTSRQNVIQDAIQLRGSIEKQAIEEENKDGKYIRPIVLFQAQPNINEDSETFEKIKNMLIDMGVPENEIGIKTSNVDTISKLDLMSEDCHIRYIITVNALKEGWDCPFAYILASLANKTSKIDVEQIVGRILRQPHAKQYKASLLNTSFVLTCSSDFRATLNTIVDGLNKAGFSRKDYRVGNVEDEKLQRQTEDDHSYTQQKLTTSDLLKESIDDFHDISPEEVKTALDKSDDVTAESVTKMITQATEQTSAYESALKDNDLTGFIGGELGDMLKQNQVQAQYREGISDIKIPQFYVKSVPDMFGACYELLEIESLSDGFSLSGQDAQVSFELATGEMYHVDIQSEGDAVPKYKRATKEESIYIRDLLAKLPPERKINYCVDAICKQINKNNRYATAEIKEYVKRIIKNMTDDELEAMETAIPTYAKKISDKIGTLENDYREMQFYKWLDSGKIICKDSYTLPHIITPAYTTDAIPYSLYEAEKDDMNEFEHKVIDVIVGLPNIKWWHRIIERKDFKINGFINHYPDFMIMTKSNMLILIEAKGDYLDGDDSKTKLKLGRQWQSSAGRLYRYFMVFEDKELEQDGAYKLDKFVDVFREL